jgi:hypothetical protein
MSLPAPPTARNTRAIMRVLVQRTQRLEQPTCNRRRQGTRAHASAVTVEATAHSTPCEQHRGTHLQQRGHPSPQEAHAQLAMVWVRPLWLLACAQVIDSMPCSSHTGARASLTLRRPAPRVGREPVGVMLAGGSWSLIHTSPRPPACVCGPCTLRGRVHPALHTRCLPRMPFHSHMRGRRAAAAA